MPRRAALSALALTATVSILAGCGSSSSGGNGGSGGSTGGTNDSSAAPVTELTNAIDALGKASTIDAVLKLNGSGSDVQGFVTQQDPGSTLTSTQAAEIAGVQISIEAAAPSGKTLADLSGSTAGASSITISDQGKALFALRVVNKTLYFQIAAKDLFDKLGQSATFAQIQAGGSQLPAFVQALIEGKWVALPEATAKSLTSQLGGSAASSGANQGEAAALLGKLKDLLTKDVKVTRTTSGSTDVLTLSGNSRTLAGDFVSTFAGSIPGAGAALGSADLSNVPDKTLSLQASVTGGALSGLMIDLGQFAKSGKGSLPIELTLGQSGPAISAPSGAVPVDTAELGQLLGSLGSGL